MKVFKQIIIGLIAISVGIVIGTTIAYLSHDTKRIHPLIDEECCNQNNDPTIIYRRT